MNFSQYIIFKHYIGAILCKNLYRTSSKTGTVKHKDHMYIAIKGTSTARDWRCNLNVKKNASDIHTGFLGYADECFYELKTNNSIYNMKDCSHIVLSSHSLGACAAVLLLYNLMLHYGIFLEGKHIDLVMFGSPKPGGSAFTKEFARLMTRYDVDVYRYNNKYDVIPNYPPLDGYNHISDEIILDPQNIKRTNVYADHCLDSYIYNLLRQSLTHEPFIYDPFKEKIDKET